MRFFPSRTKRKHLRVSLQDFVGSLIASARLSAKESTIANLIADVRDVFDR